jgi:hypothetical protein
MIIDTPTRKPGRTEGWKHVHGGYQGSSFRQTASVGFRRPRILTPSWMARISDERSTVRVGMEKNIHPQLLTEVMSN